MLRINGVDITAPKAFQVDIEDVDGESGRNARGEMLRDRIAIKRKLNCEWGPLNYEQISTILKSVKDVFFTVSYPDPEEGTTISKTFYVGNRNMPMLNNRLWEGLKMSFVEK